jgi:UDP-galactopyranose mutase
MVKQYDTLVVGSGIYGATYAYLMKQAGKHVLVIDKRSEMGGNIRCENVGGINVHKYGAHIFHTSDRRIWNFVNQFVEFRPFVNSPIAIYQGRLFNLPFNMNTFHQLWPDVITPQQAKARIQQQVDEAGIKEPHNLEEQALSMVGRDIYEVLIKEYTEKQWGRKCTELPSFIIHRLPVRLTYDNNYFNDIYQGIPDGGYNLLIEGLLKDIEVRLDTDYFSDRQAFNELADTILYTGPIDQYFDYSLGRLEWRSLRFESEDLPIDNYQGNAVVNFTSLDIPYTRIIEHKHFEHAVTPHTVITCEYSLEAGADGEPVYPINDERNNTLYKAYHDLALQEKNVLFGGRLAQYNYYDMDKIVAAVLNKFAPS